MGRMNLNGSTIAIQMAKVDVEKDVEFEQEMETIESGQCNSDARIGGRWCSARGASGRCVPERHGR